MLVISVILIGFFYGVLYLEQVKHPKINKRSKSKDSGKNRGSSREVADGEKQKVLTNLMEAFASASLEEAASAYKEAYGDPDKAAEILPDRVVQEDQSTCTTCSSSSSNLFWGSSSSTNGSDVLVDASDFIQGNGYKQKSKCMSKKVVASAGIVSTMLGKEYVRSTPKKVSSKSKGFHEEYWRNEEAEQFLCSMLGDESELGLSVVTDVLCQCGYNLEKALDVLLELSASSKEQASEYSGSTADSGEDTQYMLDSNDNLTDRTSDSSSRSSETELQENVWFRGNPFRGTSKASRSNEPNISSETGYYESGLPQKVLESLFNMPTPKTAEHEPSTANWRNVVKQLTSLGQGFESGESKQGRPLNAEGDEYQVLRASAKQHWDSMKSYYQKATTAYTNGEKEYAVYLSEQGRLQNKKAREADEKASQDIFAARNQSIENMITIDLHGQHLKQAMRLLKLHLLFGASVRSVRLFRVITGCGSHGVGKSKLKNSVIDLLKKDGIEYSEENRGTLLIRLNGRTDFSFLDSISDTE